MKKLLVTILTLAILLSVAPSLGTVADAATPDLPFTAMTWDPAELADYGNIAQAPVIQVKNIGGNITLGSGTPEELAKSIKTKLDKLPDGMRHIRLFNTKVALELGAKHVIYVGEGITQLRAKFEAFIEAYYALGGKLDGVILDTEDVDMGNWYIYGSGYGGVYPKDIHNHNFYHELVAHPRYATEIRPLLEEYGFVFYEKIGGDRSELWSIFPYQYLSGSKYPTYDKDYAKYASCASIWNRVMYDRQAMYFNYALLEPLAARYPDAAMSDYQAYEGKTWYKNLYTYSNGMKVGNVSNTNDYSHLPNASYFKDGSVYLYKNPASYNNAVYDDDPYGMLLWNINKLKNIQAGTDSQKISVWISRYDYGRATSYKGNTAYYTESLYHYGMMDPQPFLIYMTVSEGGGQAGYNERLKYMSEALSELTRVAGYSDRKPILVPANWNDGYMLTGMYAGGRNIWRITPDVTGGTTLAAFKVKDSDPTFRINGTTVTFPGGKIIKDTAVTLGSTGYWVETAKNVMPVVTRDADRYAKNPSFVENYESYAAGTVLTASNVANPQTWEIYPTTGLTVTEQGGNKALALTGSASLKHVKLPKNITAGDSYAKRQAWEITVTLPKALNGGHVTLLNSGADGGFKLEGSKVYYDENGTYKELAGVTLAAGKAYTLKRDFNFGNYTCTYSVYADGKLLKQAAGVKIKMIEVPVTEILMSCTNLTDKVLIDDYKLYPTGIAYDLTAYDANGGEEMESTEKIAKHQVGYRLSWMNATAEAKNIRVKAAYYSSDNGLISETVLATVKMAPGDDGVIAGVVQNLGAKVTIYLEDAAGAPIEQPTVPTVKPTQTPTIQVADPTTTPTKGHQSLPSKAPIMLGPTKATAATTPGATKAPGVTSATQETLAPGATSVTEETLAPGQTQAPGETQAPAATTDSEVTKSTEATTSDKNEDKGEDKNKDKGGNNTIIIVVGIVVALAAAGTAVYFFVIKKKD